MGFFKKPSIDELRAETRRLETQVKEKREYDDLLNKRNAMRDEVSGRKKLKETASRVADKLANAGRKAFDEPKRKTKTTDNDFFFNSPLLDEGKGKKKKSGSLLGPF